MSIRNNAKHSTHRNIQRIVTETSKNLYASFKLHILIKADCPLCFEYAGF